MPQKKITFPNIKIETVPIERVENFNLLGTHLNERMSWKTHTDNKSNKISRTTGVLKRLKFIIPVNIKCMIYNALILSRINYGINLYGYDSSRILKLQKKAIRSIVSAKYNSHTEPIFKSLNLLKVNDLFSISQLKFYHKLINKNLPKYFSTIPI